MSEVRVERLLIDECLSQSLLAVAKERGIYADHVVWLGKSGMQDWNLIPFALDHDYAFVTNNRRDFLRQYARLSAHAGLIILVPLVERDAQMGLFGLVLDCLQTVADTVNKLVEVFADGEIRVRDWPHPITMRVTPRRPNEIPDDGIRYRRQNGNLICVHWR